MNTTTPKIQMETSEGGMVWELWPDVAPNTCDHILSLVADGFYDGLTFHRIIPQFVIQGGCPAGDGTGGSGTNIPAEFNDREHEKGVLSMARTEEPDSASSQFFICLGRKHCQHLDGQYTAFGKVVEGIETVDKIASTPLSDPQAGMPASPPQIHRVSVVSEE